MTGWRNPKDPLAVPKSVRLRDRAAALQHKAGALIQEADALLAEADQLRAAAEKIEQEGLEVAPNEAVQSATAE